MTDFQGKPQVVWQNDYVSKRERAAALGQSPRCLWLTGLPGAGKTTVARALERRLHEAGRHVYVLDGDNVRHGLNRDLGFSNADRAENIRRVAEVARLLVDAGLIVIVALISPFRKDRELARSLFASGEFVEVFIDAPVDVCEQRDPKGLYALARQGQIKDFTGVDSPYEKPETPDVRIDTSHHDVDGCITQIIETIGSA
ncbi:adenylyl-sulfate kinase [Azonexus sp.]|jgi:adenylyl-sulfate kinase|uniref:adenylyl-sulfate kinase n=1 Tax=Azonexus sp. TaxID=1872668 RepID=UPI00283AA288|nr:adenylyl-sulfate kinase [Azonexus sp.]